MRFKCSNAALRAMNQGFFRACAHNGLTINHLSLCEAQHSKRARASKHQSTRALEHRANIGKNRHESRERGGLHGLNHYNYVHLRSIYFRFIIGRR